MLASINPLGERVRGRRWGRTVAAYLAGSAVGGLAVGGLLGELGRLIAALGAAAVGSSGGLASGLAPWSPRLALGAGIAALCAVAALLDATGRVPTRHRQVDEGWPARYRGWVYGAGFGVQLGSGGATTVTTSGVYLLGILVLLGASPLLGGALGAVFGLTRAAPILLGTGVEDAPTLRVLHRRIAAWEDRARWATVAAFGLAGVLGAAVTLR